jgi:DNA-directed RNA polymerase specialized sigma24 family protein
MLFNMSFLTHEQLALFNRRDRQIFDIVFRHYYAHIKLFAHKILNKNEMVANEITNQVFMELLKSSAPFNTEENIRVWLFLRAEYRCRSWQLQEKQKALRKEWMEQSKDPDNKDTQLQQHMEIINDVITIVNELPKKYKQDALRPGGDPEMYWDFANILKIILVNGDVPPETNRGVVELASWFAENRSWAKLYCNGGWLQEQSRIYKNIDLDERCKTLGTMVAEEQEPPTVQATPFYPEPVKKKLLTMGFYARAAIFIAVLAGIPGKKSNPMACNNVQQPTADKSTRQPNVYKITTVDSFANTGSNRHVSTDEAVNEPLYRKWAIPASGYREIKLPDSSRVWLSSMTTFIYPRTFSGNKRAVEITGEAYFEVTPNAMPFQAIVNGVYIETVGACFNVKAHEEEAGKKVTVLKGAVRVLAGPNDVLIRANQSALIEQQKRIAILLNEDTAKVVAWKDREFLFIDDSLAVVARELARRYNLVIKGNINSGTMISYAGSRLEKPAGVLKHMQLGNENFHCKMVGRYLIFE